MRNRPRLTAPGGAGSTLATGTLLLVSGLPGLSTGCGFRTGPPVVLILQVATEDVLVETVDAGVQTAREQATQKGIVFESAHRSDATSFVIEDVDRARIGDLRNMLAVHFDQGWEIAEDANDRLVVRLAEAHARSLRERAVMETIRVLERRVRELRVSVLSDAMVTGYDGAPDQVKVELWGITDVESAKRILTQRAQLQLKLVEDTSTSRETLLKDHGGAIPPTLEIAEGLSWEPGKPIFCLVRREALITGRDFKSARAGIDPQSNSPDIQFTLNPVAADKFKRETGRNVGRRLAIILDGSVASAPTINAPIGAYGQITGRFTPQQADDLAKILRAGALPVRVTCLQVIGPAKP